MTTELERKRRPLTQRLGLLSPALALCLMSACGDEDNDNDVVDAGDVTPGDGDVGDGDVQPDAGGDGDVQPDAGGDGDGDLDAGPDAGGDGDQGDAGVDAGPEEPALLTEVSAAKAPLSAEQADRFFDVTFGTDGKIYAAGFTTVITDTFVDRVFAVARFDTTGALDTSYSDDGIATVNITPADGAADTTETARAIAVQSDGKIVVVGNVKTGEESLTVGTITKTLPEVDMAVVRFDTNGDVDSLQGGFSVGDADGKDGVLMLNLGDVTATLNAAGTDISANNDGAWGLEVDSKNRVLVFGSGLNEAGLPRVDLDRYVVRLTPNGELDTTFDSDGKHSYDVNGNNNDNGRHAVILPGDMVLAGGYTNIQGRNHLAIARFKEDGTPDTSFEFDGFLASNPLGPKGFVEAYAVAVQSSGNIVTIGYGTDGAPRPNSVVSFRFGPTGSLDTSWGVNGMFFSDELADVEQGRNLAVLPDDRIVFVGNASPEKDKGDALLTVLTEDGEFDATFHADGLVPGLKTYDFGLTSDALFGIAVSPDGKFVAAAGYAGTPNGAAVADVAKEDAALVILSLD